MSISNREVETTVMPLRLIFWGGLICIFDSTVIGEGWEFDIINDLVGMLMIAWGVYRLVAIRVHDRYRSAMRFVTVIALLSCLAALHGHFVYDTPLLLSFLLSALGALAVAATVLFCIAMRWLCSEAALQRAERSWRTTTLLFAFIWLFPLGLFYGAAAIAMVTGTTFGMNLGPVGLLLMAVFCIPLVHLFVSTSRMKADADSSAHIGQQGAARHGDSAALHPHQ